MQAAVDYTRIAKKYARDVTSGKVTSCEALRQAVARWERGFELQTSKDWPFKFSKDAANRVCTFFSTLRYTEGRKAGQPVEWLPWQVWYLCDLFGWVHKRTGKRRYIYSHLFIAKKNGKSFLDSGNSLYMAFMDGEYNALVLTYAGSKDQASIVLDTAQDMVRVSEGTEMDLGAELELLVEAHTISRPGDGSVLKHNASRASTQHGPKPNCVIVDELHEVNDELWMTVRSGILSREQPLLITTSTAGFDTSSRGYQVYKFAKEILAGKQEDESVHALIFEAESDDFSDEREWLKANPSWEVMNQGVFRSDCKAAQSMVGERGKFLTLNLNRWAGAAAGWMPMEHWRRTADPTLTLKDPEVLSRLHRLPPPVIGLDVALTHDFYGIAYVFRGEPTKEGKATYEAFFSAHVSERIVSSLPNSAVLKDWAAQGHLTVHPGEVVDGHRVAREVADFVGEFPGANVCFDPAFGDESTVQIYQALGLDPVEVKTNNAEMNEPMNTTEVVVREARLGHEDNPLVDWMMGNVVADADKFGRIMPTKSSDPAKIDVPVALLIAMSQAIKAGDQVPSLWVKFA